VELLPAIHEPGIPLLGDDAEIKEGREASHSRETMGPHREPPKLWQSDQQQCSYDNATEGDSRIKIGA
jgi:hypothetical protein